MGKLFGLFKPLHVVAATLFMLLCAGSARAKTTGTISGVVSGKSGALIQTATVTLRNEATGLVRVATADESGCYQFLAVPIGEGYSIEGTALGFQNSIQTTIALLVKQAHKVDAKLDVGTVDEAVSVSSSTLQVDTTGTQMGEVIQSTEVFSAKVDNSDQSCHCPGGNSQRRSLEPKLKYRAGFLEVKTEIPNTTEKQSKEAK